MAKLIPLIEKILRFNVKPEEGELALLQFLSKTLDDSFEVYFNPYMNGDRPDIVIVRKGYGVLIIEVKDWNLDLYKLDKNKHWLLKENNSLLKSPIDQVFKYKRNLYELHIDKLLEMKIMDIRKFNVVTCAVYFHKANSNQIKTFLMDPFEQDKKYRTFMKYNIDLLGYDNLNEPYFCGLLRKRYLIANYKLTLFTEELYKSFSRFLNPPIHMKAEGEDFHYSKKQLEIIDESDKKQQRIKGVVGSGKTTVLAARAVKAYKRAAEMNPEARVLILTFNITLKNFIHDKISIVRDEFPWRAFVISNYHHFINSELNNLGIPVVLSDELSSEESKYTEKGLSIPSTLSHRISEYLEMNYYSNKEIFLKRKNDIITYESIFIDEIQDYKRSWMDIIKECFLSKNGEYLLFGDVKQNIYDNPIQGRDVVTNIQVRPIELRTCFRSDFKIRDLAIEYQKNIFKEKYDIDNFNANPIVEQLGIQFERNGYVNYINLSNNNIVSTLYTIISGNIINKNDKISPNDITVLGFTIDTLRKFETYYRYSSGERTTTMFETNEIIYRQGFNYFKNESNMDLWVKDGVALIGRSNLEKKDVAFNELSTLFTLYDLYVEYKEQFSKKMSRCCLKYKTSLCAFETYIDKYKDPIEKFKTKIMRKDYKIIRDNKKIHFWMNSGTIKISTIHSFKGWESEVLFLILEKKNDNSSSFDELLYTGITRCRSNLVIINFGNEEYDCKIRPLIDSVK